MADTEKPVQPKAKVQDILDEFGLREDMLGAFCSKTKGLIEASLEDAKIRIQSVQARVKSKAKLKQKYLDPAKDYKCLDDITDLAGLRVITYYEDDVDRVAEVIKREFNVDLARSVDKRKTEPDRFGYNAINYVCTHDKKRTLDVEYKKFAEVLCEIQITSILRHAWSELEHEWYDLKSAYPDPVKRRFYRIAALLEVAESEFLDLRQIRSQYEKSVAVRVEANVLDVPVDSVSLKAFAETEPLITELDKLVSAAVGAGLIEEIPDRTFESVAKVVNAAGISTLGQLSELLKHFANSIPNYARLFAHEIRPNPPAGLQIYRLNCIYYLCFIFANVTGVDATTELLRGMDVILPISAERQIAIAKSVLKKAGSN